MTPEQIQMYLDHMPDVEYRASYMLAKLSADIKNMMGGKPDPAKQSDKPPPDPALQYGVEEELPWFARAPETALMSLELARAIMTHRKSLPLWARKLLNVDEAERVIGANVN